MENTIMKKENNIQNGSMISILAHIDIATTIKEFST